MANAEMNRLGSCGPVSADAGADSGRDATPTDQGVPDQLAPDEGVPDQQSPDVKADLESDAPPPHNCAVLYPTADQVCGSVGNVCRVAARLGGQGCTNYCSANGGTCVGAFFNDGDQDCVPVGVAGCTDTSGGNICPCAKGQRPTPTSCEERFDDGWICSEPAGGCVVAAPLFTLSCDAYCNRAGYRCTAAWDVGGSSICNSTTTMACSAGDNYWHMCHCIP